jgi:hypothetical protein
MGRIVAVWEAFFERAAMRAMGGEGAGGEEYRTLLDTTPKKKKKKKSSPRRRQQRGIPPAAAEWEEVWDFESELPYYRARQSGDVAWEPPPGAHVDGDGRGGWARAYDEWERAYYHHETTGESRWEPPASIAHLFDDDDDDDDDLLLEDYEPTWRVATVLLLLSFDETRKRCYDPETADFYYEDELTGEMSR